MNIKGEGTKQLAREELALLLNWAAEGILGIDLEGRCTYCNSACLQGLRYLDADELLGRTVHHLIHRTPPEGMLFPDEDSPLLRVLQTGEGVHLEDEILWRGDGTHFHAECWSHARRRGGEITGAVITFIDVTERRRLEQSLRESEENRLAAEESLRAVSSKLIAAQEQERKRIARELHDDINQRLAILAIELDRLKDTSSMKNDQLRNQIEHLFKRTEEISTDLQSLSHQLHCSNLEYLGIVPGIESLCRELADHHKVTIDFAYSNVPKPLPADVELGLFRVLQEGLQNAVKHSGVQRFEIQLQGMPGEVQLTIQDSGAGFNPEAAMSGNGLGLVSMRERVNLLKGTISIRSKPKCGTKVIARIPVAALNGISRDAAA